VFWRKTGAKLFITYNYYKQYNAGKAIEDHKTFYKTFSNTREFGGSFTGYDLLVKNRFMDIFGHLLNITLRKQPKKVLDIGCGNGVNLPLANVFPTMEFHGLDYADVTVEKAKSQYPNIKFHVEDAFHTSFESGTFDLTILSSVLILYRKEEDQINLLSEVKRILNKDGVFVLIVWNDSWMLKQSIRLSRFLGMLFKQNLPTDFMGVHFSHREIEALSKKVGFRIEEKLDTGHWYGILESVRYLSFNKYNRVFGSVESEAKVERPQSILRDLQDQAGKLRLLISIFYRMARRFPSLFSMYTIYVLKKD
jgi:SAM-dependent methyltransferase